MLSNPSRRKLLTFLIPGVILIALILVLLASNLLQPAGHPLIQDDAGAVVGPVPWIAPEGSRVTLCRVVGDTQPAGPPDPMAPLRCTFDAALTVRLDAKSDFTLRDVPPGWYLFFYERQTVTEGVRTYDDILAEWDGQTIPIGDVDFAMAMTGGSDTVSVPAGCPVANFQYCMVYALETFNQTQSPIQLATDVSNDTANMRFTYAVAHVTTRSAVRVGFGQGEVIAADPDSDNVLSAEDNCPDTANANQANGDGDDLGDVCDACPNEAGTANGCPDADADGLADAADNCPQTANPGQADTDGDGTGEACQDDDQDAVMNDRDQCPAEAGVAALAGCPDADEDGVADAADLCPDEAGDVSGCPDPDGDGAVGPDEDCPAESGTLRGCPNADGDRLPDSEDNCPQVPNNDQADADGNGTGDACQDVDEDGVLDRADLCPEEAGDVSGCPDPDGDGAVGPDEECPEESGTLRGCPNADGDTWPDGEDNCPAIVNDDQADADGDGTGDVCQDDDGDGATNDWDACPDEAGLTPWRGCPAEAITVDTIARVQPLLTQEYTPRDRPRDQVVADVALSPDGALLATSLMDTSIRLWDIGTNAEPITLSDFSMQEVRPLMFSPDGQYLVGLGHSSTFPMADSVWAWSRTGEQLAQLTTNESEDGRLQYVMALSPDGSLLATGTTTDSILLWDTTTWRVREILHATDTWTWAVRLAFSPDSTLLGVSESNGVIGVWDIEQADWVWKTNPPQTASLFSALAFSPDGTRLAHTGVAGEQSIIYLKDVTTGEQVAEIPGECDDLAFSPDGSLLAFYDFGSGRVVIWDSVTGEQRADLGEISLYAESPTFSPDGSLLVAGLTTSAIGVWDAETGEIVAQLEGHTSTPNRLRFSADGTLLVSASTLLGENDPVIRVWGVMPPAP